MVSSLAKVVHLSSDLFEYAENNSGTARPVSGPLAYRMRPQHLGEFVGQERLLGVGKPLRQWIEQDRVPSILFWGPPGCGKTSLAQIIALRTQSRFVSLSGVLSGIKEIKEAVEEAREHSRLRGRKTLLFIDEIHRFNKVQQDSLLPHVEAGIVTLIGATTENPSFEVNSALLSRVRVLRLERLNDFSLVQTLQRALQDPNGGLGGLLKLSTEAIQWIAKTSDGDARRALTALESIALYAAQRQSSGEMSLSDAQEALDSASGMQPILYDPSGEEHFNLISALIKSVRGSDPHAGLYYLARMLEGGEDPLFIARRLVIFASEDIGNADPRALTVALAVKDAVDFVGMPEARISLAQAVTYLSVAPKSNASYAGIELALNEVRNSGSLPVPFHLRNQYAPSNAKVSQAHLPDALFGREFYFPKGSKS